MKSLPSKLSYRCFRGRRLAPEFDLLKVIAVLVLFHDLPENFTRVWRERKDPGSGPAVKTRLRLCENEFRASPRWKPPASSRVKIRFRYGLSSLISLFLLDPRGWPTYYVSFGPRYLLSCSSTYLLRCLRIFLSVRFHCSWNCIVILFPFVLFARKFYEAWPWTRMQ